MSLRWRRPTHCPKCGSDELKATRSPLRFILGVLLAAAGLLTALFTLGMSLVFALVGMSLMMKRLRCQRCGWESTPQGEL
jgi:predicted Zn-ribbon and HTH transcriptional regulator